MRRTLILIFCALLLCPVAPGAELRVGIIGCDTSHVPEFTEVLNNPEAKGHVPGAKVVAAFPGGSKDIPSSWSRLDGYTKTLREKYEVRIYDSIEVMCRDVDAVLLESLDGRPHLEQARLALKARKPLFIDKPMAGSLRDVIEIFRLARETGTPVFSSSSLRFAKDTQAARNGAFGKLTYVETYGPCEREPHHPDLFWYGVHGVEALYAILGRGCQTVQRETTPEGKIRVVGSWNHGRTGIFCEDKSFHGVARGEKGEVSVGSFDGYAPLLAAIVKFFQTGVAPVAPEETMEIFAFLEAADTSKKQNGAPINIRELLAKAAAN